MRKMKKTLSGFILLSMILAGCQSNSSSLSGEGTSSISTSSYPDNVTSLKVMVIDSPRVLAPSLISNTDTYNDLSKYSPYLLTESQGIFEKKLQEVKETKPDVLILTGDLTYQGEKASHEVVSTDLINLKTELQKTNPDFKIVLVPGEGDINNKSATSYNSAVTDSQLTSLADYKTMYASVCYDDALEKYTPTSGESGSLAYSISVANGYNFVVMDDIRYTKETTTSTSTKSLTPQGIIESDQLAFLKAQTLAFRKKGQAVIGLNHHSLSAHYLVQSTLGYTITENASTVTKTLADAGMSVVFTGHESLNDVSCYHSSKDDLYDICTSASTLYPGNTRTVDFTHTYSYSKKSETLNFKSSLQATTDISYLDTDKQTKTIDDLSSTLNARTLTSSQIAQEAKASPYEYLYSSYPDLKPDTDGNQNKTLGDVLDGVGYSAKEINSQISSKIGTPTAPTYIKDGSIFTKTAGSDYKVDSDGNAIDYDLVMDYGIHSNFSTTSDSYRIVLSGDYIKNTLAPDSSIFTGTVYDIVFYVSDETMESEINHWISLLNEKFIKSDTNWNNIVDALVNGTLDNKVDDSHTVLDLITTSLLIHLAGGEEQPAWIKSVSDDVGKGTKSTVLSNLIDSLSDQAKTLFDNTVGFFDFDILLDGATVDTSSATNVIGVIAIKASFSALKKVLVGKTLSDVFTETMIKKVMSGLKTNEKMNTVGLVLQTVIDDMTLDYDTYEDNNSDITSTYSVAYYPKA